MAKLIGTAPDQIPLNGMLGGMAYQDPAAASFVNASFTGQSLGALGTALLPAYSFLSDPNTGMWSPSGDVIAWSVGGSEKLRLDASGKLGIGTATPETLFNIVSAGTATALGQLDTNIRLHTNTATAGAGSEISFRAQNASSAANVGTYAAISAPVVINGAAGATGYLTFATKALAADTALTERMRLTSTGRLGHGITVPVAQMHTYVADGGHAFGVSGDTKGLRFSTGSSFVSVLGVDSTLTASFQPVFIGGTYLAFGSGAGALESMRLDTTGRLGIGTSSPGYKLHVLGNFGIAPGVGTTVTPASNADLVIETTSNTTLTFKLKGSDGVVRTGTVALA